MKKIIIFWGILFSINAYADWETKIDWHPICKVGAENIGFYLKQRFNGVTLLGAMDNERDRLREKIYSDDKILSDKREELITMLFKSAAKEIIFAYEQPFSENNQIQNKIIRKAVDEWLAKCLKETSQ